MPHVGTSKLSSAEQLLSYRVSTKLDGPQDAHLTNKGALPTWLCIRITWELTESQILGSADF